MCILSLMIPIVARKAGVLLLVFVAAPSFAAERLLFDDFESGTVSKQIWFDVENRKTKITSRPDDVHSGRFALAFPGLYSPTIAFLSRPTREAYIAFWWKFPDDFTWNPHGRGGRHFWRLAYGDVDHSLRKQIDTGAGDPGAFGGVFLIGNGDEMPFGCGAGCVPEGGWFHFEYHVRLNSPGKSDGLVAGWIDGEKKYEMTAIDFRADDVVFNLFHATTNYDNCTGRCGYFMDDIEIWDGCPEGSSCYLP